MNGYEFREEACTPWALRSSCVPVAGLERGVPSAPEIRQGLERLGKVRQDGVRATAGNQVDVRVAGELLAGGSRRHRRRARENMPAPKAESAPRTGPGAMEPSIRHCQPYLSWPSTNGEWLRLASTVFSMCHFVAQQVPDSGMMSIERPMHGSWQSDPPVE